MRRAELARLKVSDIDSQRMIIRVVAGKGGKDRDLPLSPALLETLREYWRWRQPKVYMFPTRTRGQTLDQPISDKTVWIACNEAARQAGIKKRIYPAHPAPQLGDPLIRSGYRLANHPGFARARGSRNHSPVSASVAAALADGCQSAGRPFSRQHPEHPSQL